MKITSELSRASLSHGFASCPEQETKTLNRNPNNKRCRLLCLESPFYSHYNPTSIQKRRHHARPLRPARHRGSSRVAVRDRKPQHRLNNPPRTNSPRSFASLLRRYPLHPQLSTPCRSSPRRGPNRYHNIPRNGSKSPRRSSKQCLRPSRPRQQ